LLPERTKLSRNQFNFALALVSGSSVFLSSPSALFRASISETTCLFVVGDVRIFARGEHLSPIVTHRLDGITHIADDDYCSAGEMEQEEEKDGGKRGQERPRRRIIANIFIGRRKKNCPLLWRRFTREARGIDDIRRVSCDVADVGCCLV